jgi:hypothetical protein
MAATFQQSDGMIADVLQTMFNSPEFRQSLGKKFKDPMHYVVSAVRLSYDDKPILNAGPMLNWLSRMGQPCTGARRRTAIPDGPVLGQPRPDDDALRYRPHHRLGRRRPVQDGWPAAAGKAAFPQLASALYYQSLRPRWPGHAQSLDQAASPQEWNTFSCRRQK